MTTLTVKLCKKHGSVIKGYCKDCSKERHKKWLDKNKGKNSENVKKGRNKNQEKRNEHLKKWRSKNAKNINLYLKEWRCENRYADSEIKNLMAKCKPFKLSGISRMDIPTELVEIKRLQMKLHHAIKAREQQTGE